MAVGSGVMEMLKDDHEKAKKLFEDFEAAEGRAQADIAATAIMELGHRMNSRGLVPNDGESYSFR